MVNEQSGSEIKLLYSPEGNFFDAKEEKIVNVGLSAPEVLIRLIPSHTIRMYQGFQVPNISSNSYGLSISDYQSKDNELIKTMDILDDEKF